MTPLPDPEIDLLIDLLVPPPMEEWEGEDSMEEEEEGEEIDITEFFDPEDAEWFEPEDTDWDETSFWV